MPGMHEYVRNSVTIVVGLFCNASFILIYPTRFIELLSISDTKER